MGRALPGGHYCATHQGNHSHYDESNCELCRAQRERDGARAIANDRDAMVDHRDRALTAMYQRVDVITQERDKARAEVERLRSALRGLHDDIVEYQRINHLGGYDNHWMLAARAALATTEAARKFCGVGELERTGYIPAGSADEREVQS